MRDTFVSLERPEHTTIARHIRVQVDQVGDKEAVLLRQAFNYNGGDIFRIYTFDWVPNSLVRRDDVLVDELYIDPSSQNATNPVGKYFRYKITGRVKDFQFDHQECYGFVVIGG